MDLDNLEFRPLTQGLGFDKTTEDQGKKKLQVPNLAEKPLFDKKDFQLADKDFDLPNKTPVSRSLKKMLDSLPPSVDFREDKNRDLKIQAPLGGKIPVESPLYQVPVAPVTQTPFDVTLNNSLSQAFPKEEVNKRFYHQLVTPIPQYQEMAASFASAAIDGLIVLGLSSLFVVSLVGITGVDVFGMLSSRALSTRMTIELVLLYFGVTLFYFMLARGMFGSTLGDWAFDVQLGEEKERKHIMYPFQVVFRTFVIMLTGIFVIPLISVAFGKDIAYYFSGLKLYSRQY